jgi:tripartite motif-containing protein 71
MYHILKGMWGNKGGHDGEFRRPEGISVDSKGNIYVADCDNHRIQKFNSRGEFLHKWGQYGSGNGQFNQPIAIAIDSNDYVYVTERYNTRVQKFDLNGNFIKVIGFGTGSDYLYSTQGIAVESDDDIVVVNGHGISKYSSNGNFIRSWGSHGYGDGQFQAPEGIAVDSDDDIYVPDRGLHRVQKFDPQGDFIRKWGQWPQLDNPVAIACFTRNSILVVNSDVNNVLEFTRDGYFITHWGDQFTWSAGGVAINKKNGWHYITSQRNDNVVAYHWDFGSPGIGGPSGGGFEPDVL